MWKDNLVMCFTKVRLILSIYTSIGVHKKPSRLSTSLYDQVYFNRRDRFSPSMGVIPGQIIPLKNVNIHVYSIEVGYLSLMSIVKAAYSVTMNFFRKILFSF